MSTDTPVTSTASEPARAGESASRAPDWDNVPFDVGCARCGHDLRGLSDPTCPGCGLTFDWSDAVPIEELTCLNCEYHLYGLRDCRCPECGTGFTWEEVRAAHYRRKKQLFEYRWRVEPVRSFVLSWRLAMNPRKLWRMIDIHDPPQVKPWIFTLALAAVLLVVSAPVFDGLAKWVFLRALNAPGAPGYGRLPWYVLSSFGVASVYWLPLMLIVWSAVSLAALMVFRQSMRLCRVRTVHVLRVWAYPLTVVLPVVPLLKYVSEYGMLKARLLVAADTAHYVLLALLGFFIWSIWQGYGRYLRMRHAVAVAIASQVIAVLGTAVILLGIPYLLLGRL